MGLGIDNSSSYMLGEAVCQQDGIYVFRAVEKTVESPCFFHRIMLGATAGDLERHAAAATMKRYGALQAPRTPRLVDGWVTDDHVVVVEYKRDARPLSLSDNNPLAAPKSPRTGEVLEYSLALLCALHRLNIVQGNIRPETFGVGPGGKIYLRETGLAQALKKAVNQNPGGGDMFLLSTNLSSIDLARWAVAMLDMMEGERFMPEAPEEKWDEYHLREADGKLRSLLTVEPLREFFSKSLRGLAMEVPPFESAVEAHKHWKSQKLWSYFR